MQITGRDRGRRRLQGSLVPPSPIVQRTSSVAWDRKCATVGPEFAVCRTLLLNLVETRTRFHVHSVSLPSLFSQSVIFFTDRTESPADCA